jgi:large subunit ribosomal protein L10
MAPRIPRATRQLASPSAPLQSPSQLLAPTALSRCVSTTTACPAAAAAAAPSRRFALPPDYVPPKQPPSAKPTDTRKAQLIRSYTSLVRSTPLMLLFQHNNLDAKEWLFIRRELRERLREVPAPDGCGVSDGDFNREVRVQVLRTSMFRLALKIHEFFDPAMAAADPATRRTTRHGPLVHDLSHAAREAVKDAERRELVMRPDTSYARMSPLLMGPLAALTIPAVSPAHLAAALSVLSPVPGRFPAPPRRKRPQYWDMPVQMGLQKLLLIGGRIEARVMDSDSIGWVAGLEGGVGGMRAQLVNMLGNAGLNVVSALDSTTRSLWFTLDSRRSMLEPKEEGGDEEGASGGGEGSA